MNVYPIFLNDLEGRRCVVFGGGHEGERKARELLDLGAAVVLISPEATAPLQDLAAAGRLTWLRRTYRPGDLQDAFLTIVSETNPEATAPIWEEARARNVLINAMDDVPHCTFVAGSVVRQGPLVLSISTSGCAPALSVRLRQRFEREFGPAYARFLHWMRALREPMATHIPDFETRRARWYALVDGDILDLLSAGREQEAYDRLVAIVGPEVAAALSPSEAPAEVPAEATADLP
ncbi:MAG: bifunctional precorrin-2 dehydrogenase/sirohydrochlorin ferrochelatase [Bacteroidetes bacterium]|nr:MAG: bifunctional precorrin-2 dehydrogenase/sirohydrochlorin ferrochelatase [Bacteroidota bacterium]